MKLKDLTPKGQKAINERPINRSKVDYSTMKLKSNIDQKWPSTEVMAYDLRQWAGAVLSASGPELAREIGLQLRDIGNQIIKNQDDFNQYDLKDEE